MDKNKISHDLIRQARQTDLASFLLSRGEPLRKAGRRFKHKDHDSLVITGNMYFWNSRHEKGNTLDFVMSYYGWDFLTAINELTGVSFPKVEYVSISKELRITKGSNVKRVIAYLCKTRKIRYDVVRYLIENHLLSQDERGNAVFKIYDESLELVGGEIVGTLSNTRFKSIADGTLLGYGFNFAVGEPVFTLFFESPIDLISFWSIYYDKITSHRLVSLAGLRLDIFENVISVFGVPLDSVYLCVDNDEAGRVFISSVQESFPVVHSFLPTSHKDWNDVLCFSS
jgi:hypothetical protein